jgi:2-polyprenyl-3-methyl-5-hydroxy-6-metoxy-1,4-benzoquinol methylase
MDFFPLDLAPLAGEPAPAIAWQESPCPLCGSASWTPLVEAPDNAAGERGLWFAVVQCPECGLCFTNPRPSPETIGQFYPTAYTPHVLPPKRRPFWRWRRGGGRYHQPVRWQGEGRLLDFGCGGGSFLAEMHRQGWRVTGVDTCTEAVLRIRQELGLRVFAGTLPNEELEPASFDVVTMWQSLEHVHAPLEVLQEAHRLLTPGGRLYVAAPNIDSLPFRRFGPAWFGLDLPRHLTHFTPWTLHHMLEVAGFRVRRIRTVQHSQWLRASARLACRLKRASLGQRLLRAKPAARLASWYCTVSGQGDCVMAVAER